MRTGKVVALMGGGVLAVVLAVVAVAAGLGRGAKHGPEGRELQAGVATPAVAVATGAAWGTTKPGKRVSTLETADDPAPAVLMRDANVGDLPIAAGWPLALPGSIIGSPVVADLSGDGDLCIVVACMGRTRSFVPTVHPKPDYAAQLFAFTPEGKLVKGFPVVLMDGAARQARLAADKSPWGENWYGMPSTCMDHDGRDLLLTTSPGGMFRVDADGNKRIIHGGGDMWVSPPVVNLLGNKQRQIVMGYANIDIHGDEMADWPKSKFVKGAYSACVGDAAGDGTPRIYMGMYAGNGGVGGYDRKGDKLPGWPRATAGTVIFPAMGNVLGKAGKDTKQIIAADRAGTVQVWMHDGTPAPGTREVGVCKAVFKENISASLTVPTLADLDGDGVAEIILYESDTQRLYAWKGTGEGFLGERGLICELPQMRGWVHTGVSVVQLDGAGNDMFVGPYWVHVDADKNVTTKMILPEYQVRRRRNVVNEDGTTAPARIGAPITYWMESQPTVADLYGDGKAEVIIATADGKLWVVETGKTLKPQWEQWPTEGGNYQHTNVWTDPRGRKKRP